VPYCDKCGAFERSRDRAFDPPGHLEPMDVIYTDGKSYEYFRFKDPACRLRWQRGGAESSVSLDQR
jgi:hypothetical protein